MTRILLASLAVLGATACTLDREGGLDAPSSSGGAIATGGSGTGIMTGPGGTGGMPTTGGSGPGAGGSAPGVGGTGPGGGDVCPTGWTCVADPMAGTLVSRTDGGNCPTGWQMPTPLYNDNNLPGCNNSCSCGAPQGGSCSVTVTRHTDNSCGAGNVKDGPTTIAVDQCQNVAEVNPTNQADSYDVPPPALNAGTCVGAGADKPPVDATVMLCSPAAPPTMADCNAGEICVPEPQAMGACVMFDGDVDCPDAYSSERILFATVTDNRICECDCGNEDGTCGDATVMLYNDNSCGSSAMASQTASGCWDVSGFNGHDSYQITGGAYTAGTCNVMEVDQGEVTLSDLRTVCCVDNDD